MGFLKALFGGHEETPEEKAEKTRNRNFDVLKYDGIRARKVGEVKYAIRCFQEALSLKEDAETMQHLAEALLADGQAEESHHILTQAATINPQSLEIRLGMILADERIGNYTRMDEDCRAALELAPENAVVLYRSAQAKHALQDELNAVALLTRAIMQDENLNAAYLLRAEVLQSMGVPSDAEADIDHLLRSPEVPEEVLLLKADLRLQQGDAASAITYYNKVVIQNPMMREAYLKLCHAYTANRQLDGALQALDEVLELFPDFGEAYKERGRIKLQLNDKAGATDDLKKALEYDREAAKDVEGKFTNIEQEMNAQYKSRNPMGF